MRRIILSSVVRNPQLHFSTCFYTGCPTRYRTRHFFNNSNTNEDMATKQTHTTDTFLFISHTTNIFLFKSRCNIFIAFRILKEMPGLVGSGTPVCFVWIWEQTAIISLYSIKWLVCITETERVYCAVRTGFLNKTDCISSLRSLFKELLAGDRRLWWRDATPDFPVWWH